MENFEEIPPAMVSIQKYKQKKQKEKELSNKIYAQMRQQAAESEKEESPQPQVDMTKLDLDKLFDSITKEEQHKIMNLPQHFPDGSTNINWLQSRVGVMTGSRVADVLKHGFKGHKGLLRLMVWPEHAEQPNQVFCKYGLRNEDTCEQVLVRHLQRRVRDPMDPLDSFRVLHFGLIKDLTNQSRGYSPDAVIEEFYFDGSNARVLAEFKCPYTKRFTKKPALSDLTPDVNYSAVAVFDNKFWTLEEKKEASIYGPERVPPSFPGRTKTQRHDLPIKIYYYDQVQWGMRLLLDNGILSQNETHMPTMKCYFVVWTPKYSNISSIPYCPEYSNWMLKEVDTFMAQKYLKTMRLRQSGKLKPGTVEFTIEI